MHDDVIGRMPIVEQIAQETWPDWRNHLPPRTGGMSWQYDPLLQIARQVLVMLNRKDELEQNLGVRSADGLGTTGRSASAYRPASKPAVPDRQTRSGGLRVDEGYRGTGPQARRIRRRDLRRRPNEQSVRTECPHEALLGILALLHGASSSEVRHLHVSHVDAGDRTIRLGKRPQPVPLDPASWQVLQRCLALRGGQRTANPHVIVTKGTKAGRAAASTAYMSHVLDPCSVPPRRLRCTRLAGLVNTLDPKLVAAAFGMNPEGVMIYLADHVDPARLPSP